MDICKFRQLASLLLVVSLAGIAFANWPMEGSDAAFTGYTPDLGPTTLPPLQWTAALSSGYPIRNPTVDQFNVFVNARYSSPNPNSLTTINRQTGSIAWTRPGASFAYSPLFAGTRVYFQDNENTSALDPATGSMLFSANISDGRSFFAVAPRASMIYANGTIYFRSFDHIIHARSRYLGFLWKVAVGGQWDSRPVAYSNYSGTLYVTGTGGLGEENVYRYSSEGVQLATVPWFDAARSSPVPYKGKVLVITSDNRTIGYNPDLTLSWSRQLDYYPQLIDDSAGPSVAFDKVYVPASSPSAGKLYAFNYATGATVWDVPIPNHPDPAFSINSFTKPAISGNGVIYLPVIYYAESGNMWTSRVHAFDASTGALLFSINLGADKATGISISEGQLFVGFASFPYTGTGGVKAYGIRNPPLPQGADGFPCTPSENWVVSNTQVCEDGVVSVNLINIIETGSLTLKNVSVTLVRDSGMTFFPPALDCNYADCTGIIRAKGNLYVRDHNGAPSVIRSASTSGALFWDVLIVHPDNSGALQIENSIIAADAPSSEAWVIVDNDDGLVLRNTTITSETSFSFHHLVFDGAGGTNAQIVNNTFGTNSEGKGASHTFYFWNSPSNMLVQRNVFVNAHDSQWGGGPSTGTYSDNIYYNTTARFVGSNLIVTNNTVYGTIYSGGSSRTGMECSSTGTIDCSGNRIYNASGYGLILSGGSASFVAADNLVSGACVDIPLWWYYAPSVQPCAGVRIDGQLLKLRNSTIENVRGVGILLSNASSGASNNIEVRGNTIRNITVFLNMDKEGAGIYGQVRYDGNSMQNALITGNSISQSGTGVRLFGPSGATIELSSISDVYEDGIYASGSTGSLTITQNNITNADRKGIELISTPGASVTQNRIINASSAGIYISGSSGQSVQNNFINRSTYAVNLISVSSATLNSNTFDTSSYAFYCSSVSGLSFASNIFHIGIGNIWDACSGTGSGGSLSFVAPTPTPGTSPPPKTVNVNFTFGAVSNGNIYIYVNNTLARACTEVVPNAEYRNCSYVLSNLGDFNVSAVATDAISGNTYYLSPRPISLSFLPEETLIPNIWPKFYYDWNNTGYSGSSVGPLFNDSVWAANITFIKGGAGSPVVYPKGSTVVAYGGLLYVVSSTGFASSTASFMALNATTGALAWTFDGDAGDDYSVSQYQTPAVANSIFYAQDGCNIYALNAYTGALVWKKRLNVDITPTTLNTTCIDFTGTVWTKRPAITVAYGNLYTQRAGELIVLDAVTGDFEFNILAAPTSIPWFLQNAPNLPVAIADGEVYMAGINTSFLDGSLVVVDAFIPAYKWNVSTGQSMGLGAPIIQGDLVYATIGGDLVAVDRTTHAVQFIETSNTGTTAPSLYNGRIYRSLSSIDTGYRFPPQFGLPPEWCTVAGFTAWNASTGAMLLSQINITPVNDCYKQTQDPTIYPYDAFGPGEFQSISSNGVLYVTGYADMLTSGSTVIRNYNRWLFAYDANTGRQIWNYSVPNVTGSYTNNYMVGTPVLAHHKVFMTQGRDMLYGFLGDGDAPPISFSAPSSSDMWITNNSVYAAYVYNVTADIADVGSSGVNDSLIGVAVIQSSSFPGTYSSCADPAIAYTYGLMGNFGGSTYKSISEGFLWLAVYTENTYYTICIRAADNFYANTAYANVSNIRFDKTVPSITVDQPGASACVSNLTAISATVTDAGIGVNTSKVYWAASLAADPTCSSVGFNLLVRSGDSYVGTVDSNGAPEGAGAVVVCVKGYDLLDNSNLAVRTGITVDNTGPSVGSISPSSSANVRGTISVTASVNDAGCAGTSSAKWLANSSGTCDGTWASMTNAGGANFQSTWATGSYADDLYSVCVRGYDTKSNYLTASSTSVRVDNTQPAVAFVAPTPDADSYVNGLVSLRATASDGGSGLASISIRLNGTQISSCPSSPCDAAWDTSTYSEGDYSVSALATDNAGNQNTASRTLILDKTPPIIFFIEPANGSTVAGTVLIRAIVDDDAGLDLVLWANSSSSSSCLDGNYLSMWPNIPGPGPWEAYWDSSSIPVGSQWLCVNATDDVGNRKVLAINVNVLNNAAPVINNITATEEPGHRAMIYYGEDAACNANITDQEGRADLLWANFTVTNSTGGVVVNNVNGSLGSHADIWVSQQFAATGAGDWRCDVVVKDTANPQVSDFLIFQVLCSGGTQLCQDGTCSLNCTTTDAGPQGCIGPANDVCSAGEGCACSDCDGEQGPCGLNSVCNDVTDACSCIAPYQLCQDGTCSLDCTATDAGPQGCIGAANDACEAGEGCACSDCNGEQGPCGTDAVCSDASDSCVCEPGVGLCQDGTCSLICDITDDGPKGCIGAADGTCDVGEGCGCADCDAEQGPCPVGAICSNDLCGCPAGTTLCEDSTCSANCTITDTAPKGCWGGAPDGWCAATEGCACADCAGTGASCGGTGAICSSTTGSCMCPFGTGMCADGTCSANCPVTDEGWQGCDGAANGVCGIAEGCACSDCFFEQDTCYDGLICSNTTYTCKFDPLSVNGSSYLHLFLNGQENDLNIRVGTQSDATGTKNMSEGVLDLWVKNNSASIYAWSVGSNQSPFHIYTFEEGKYDYLLVFNETQNYTYGEVRREVAVSRPPPEGGGGPTGPLSVSVSGECTGQPFSISVTSAGLPYSADIRIYYIGAGVQTILSTIGSSASFTPTSVGTYQVEASAPGRASDTRTFYARDCAAPPIITPGGCTSGSDCSTGRCVDGNCAICTDDSQCTTGICDELTGSCSRCYSDADCPAGVSCDVSSGRCGGCTSDSQCPTGFCNEQAGACERCDSNSDCASGLCNALTGDCRKCASHGECSTGLCLAGTCTKCTSNAQCPSGTSCERGSCIKPKGEPCTSGSDCTSGYCDPSKAICAPCSSGSDCASGFCSNGVCTRCTSSSQCSSGFYCSSGTCAQNSLSINSVGEPSLDKPAALRVTDATGAAVAGAKLTLNNKSYTTDKNGTASVTMAAGTNSVKAEKAGYKVGQKSFTLKPAEAAQELSLFGVKVSTTVGAGAVILGAILLVVFAYAAKTLMARKPPEGGEFGGEQGQGAEGKGGSSPGSFGSEPPPGMPE